MKSALILLTAATLVIALGLWLLKRLRERPQMMSEVWRREMQRHERREWKGL